MNRRDLLAGATAAGIGSLSPGRAPTDAAAEAQAQGRAEGSARARFPRLADSVQLNAAGGTPMGDFVRARLREYEAFWSTGEHGWQHVRATLDQTRSACARLIGAAPEEIAFVPCTKAGEQLVIDRLPALRSGGNVVTNDLHFGGSLHNLLGLRARGTDVRIVRSRDWRVDVDAMAEAIDDDTGLVALTYVSNVNGHIERLPEIAELAHAHGAYVYADVIQAAGIVPLDVYELGVDFAGCNGYKWLFGPHGAGFLFVRSELQENALEARSFPGHARALYAPWTGEESQADYSYDEPRDARRYEPGHVGYLAYHALSAGLAFVESIGVQRALDHSVRLNRRLLEAIEGSGHVCITPEPERTPIVTLAVSGDLEALRTRLIAEHIAVSFGGGRLRISPAVYNNEDDIDRLAAVLRGL